MGRMLYKYSQYCNKCGKWLRQYITDNVEFGSKFEWCPYCQRSTSQRAELVGREELE